LERARAAHLFAASELKRSEKLSAEKTVSVQELEGAQWRETAAARELAAAQSTLRQAEVGSSDPFDALKRRSRAYLRFAREHPGHYRVLFSAISLGPKDVGTYSKAPHPGAASFFALIDSVQRCLDAGAHSGSDRAAFFLAVQLWTALHGMVDLRISKPEMPWPPMEALLEATLSDLGLTHPTG